MARSFIRYKTPSLILVRPNADTVRLAFYWSPKSCWKRIQFPPGMKLKKRCQGTSAAAPAISRSTRLLSWRQRACVAKRWNYRGKAFTDTNELATDEHGFAQTC